MKNARMIAGLVLLALVIIFSIQNHDVINVWFLFWKISMSRALMIFLVFALGVAAGFLLARHRKSADKSADE